MVGIGEHRHLRLFFGADVYRMRHPFYNFTETEKICLQALKCCAIIMKNVSCELMIGDWMDKRVGRSRSLLLNRDTASGGHG